MKIPSTYSNFQVYSLDKDTLEKGNDGTETLVRKVRYTARLGHNAKRLILKASQEDDEGNTQVVSIDTLLRIQVRSLLQPLGGLFRVLRFGQ